jgi:hypothetical protein
LAFIDENVVYGFYELPDGSWKGTAWYLSDGAYKDNHFPHELDLVEVKPRIKKTVWLNVCDHLDYWYVYLSKEHADKFKHGRLACIKVEIDYEEGEGL